MEGTAGLAIRELDFTATVDLATSALRIEGNADGTTVAQFGALIGELHAVLTERGARDLAVDLRSLEFMTAACFNVFVGWLALIHELPPAQRYRLHFGLNPTLPWQRRSLRTLTCFATDLVVVET